MLPAPADPDVAAALDATGGLEPASAEDRSTRAWQVDRPLSASDLDGPRSWLRIALLAPAGPGVLVVLVLCAPTTSRTASVEKGAGDEAAQVRVPTWSLAIAAAGGLPCRRSCCLRPEPATGADVRREPGRDPADHRVGGLPRRDARHRRRTCSA